MKTIKIFLLIGLFIGLGTLEAYTDSPTAPLPKPRVIVMGLDDTGSYTLWGTAKQIAGQIVRQLAPGDIFYLRRITAASYSDEATLFRLELPTAPVSATTNPFDRLAKKRRKALAVHVQRLKRQALNQIAKLKAIKATKTDFKGFLAVASEKFALQGTDRHRLLIIASDLQDNVNYAPQLTFTDVRIAVVGFQPLPDPLKTQKLKKVWNDYFSRLGAHQIQFIRADEQIQLGQL